MNTKIPKNKIVFLPTFVLLLLCLNNVGLGVIIEEPAEEGREAPEYAPGEVLVKFKEGVEPQSILQKINLEATGIERIHSIKPAIAKFKKDYKLEKDENGWYPFLGKKYKETGDIPDEEMFKEAYKGMPEVQKALYRSYKIKLPEGMSVEEAVDRLKNDPNVEYAEPNYIVKILIVPNDPSYTEQWPHQKIKSEQAWDVSIGSQDIVIAIIDTGIYYDHPDLSSNIWTNNGEIPQNGIDDDGNGYVDDIHGYDFNNNDADPVDDHGHGTHVAGIASAVGNNGIGIAGVSWNSRLMAVKGLGAGGSGDTSNLAKCIIYAADNGAMVLNNSWGPRARLPSNPVVEEAIDYAYSKNCVIIFAAGNSSDDVAYYSPANYPKVITVAATDSADNKASFSNYGAKTAVAAPGVRVLSTVPPTGVLGDTALYKRLSGTSMACPHVAGLAALILSQHGDYDSEQVGWLIKETVDVLPNLERNFFPGFGRINSATAMQYPTAPPLLIAMISRIDIDYTNQRAHIIGTTGGRDFYNYRLEYQKDKNTLVGLYSSSELIPDGELYDWHITDTVPENALLRLTVYANDSRQSTAYASLGCMRYIDHENMSDVFYVTADNKWTRGIARLGGVVSFVGRHFGDYRLEWKKSESSEWKTDGIDYSNLDSGYLGRWDTSVVGEAGDYDIRLNDVLGSEKHAEVVLDGSIIEGWPVVMTEFNVLGQRDSSSVHSKVGNFDDDPLFEIVTMRALDNSARVYIHDDNGVLKAGWPKIFSGEMGYSYHPTLADIDGDGMDEIFISTGKREGIGFANTLYCLKANGDIVFQKKITGQDLRGDMCRDPIIVCDLNGDSIKEIIYRHSDAIYMLDPNGNDLPAWPKEMPTAGLMMSADGSPNLMAVGNFDDDPDLELVVIQYKVNPAQGFGDEIIHIFNLDSTYVPGWPQTIEGSISFDWMACGDMTDDGRDEIAVTGTDAKYNKKLYLFGRDGTMLFVKDFSGMALFCMMSDLNADNKADLVFTHKNKIYVVDASGSDIPGWPCEVPYATNTLARLICDIDGDGEPEILGRYNSKKPGESSYYWRMFVINSNGTVDTESQFYDKFVPSWTSSLNYCDIDYDGYGDLVLDASLPVWIDEKMAAAVYWKPAIYAFRTNTSYKSNPSHWPTYFADNSNTARYKPYAPDDPIVSIELEGPSPWQLNDVRMRELRRNINSTGEPMHTIRNTGNVPVHVEIKYGPLDYRPWPRREIKPGMRQGVDTFITKVGNKLLPPAKGVGVGRIGHGETMPLSLTYGAPTKVSTNAEGHNVRYELRAYKAAEEKE